VGRKVIKSAIKGGNLFFFFYLSKLNKEIQANQGPKGVGSINVPNQISSSLYGISIG
jgi:hypothetical protein